MHTLTKQKKKERAHTNRLKSQQSSRGTLGFTLACTLVADFTREDRAEEGLRMRKDYVGRLQTLHNGGKKAIRQMADMLTVTHSAQVDEEVFCSLQKK